MRSVDGGVEPQAVGDLLVGRIAQHVFAAADEHRNIRRRDVKAVEQFLRVAFAIEIDVDVGVAVPNQKLFNAQRAGAMRRADDDDVAVPRAISSTRRRMNARSRIWLSSASVCTSEQPLVIELDDVTGRTDAGTDERGPAGHEVGFAAELPRTKCDDQLVAIGRGAEDLELALEHDEEGAGRAPGSTRTSPVDIVRFVPCAAIRAIWADVRVGNSRAAAEGSRRGGTTQSPISSQSGHGAVNFPLSSRGCRLRRP